MSNKHVYESIIDLLEESSKNFSNIDNMIDLSTIIFCIVYAGSLILALSLALILWPLL